MSDQETGTPEQPREEAPLPEPSFDWFVFTLRVQAEMQLGLIQFGEDSEQVKPDLAAARRTIDLLGILLEKTRGNLSLEEHRHLENTLTELRFRYVHILEESKKQTS